MNPANMVIHVHQKAVENFIAGKTDALHVLFSCDIVVLEPLSTYTADVFTTFFDQTDPDFTGDTVEFKVSGWSRVNQMGYWTIKIKDGDFKLNGDPRNFTMKSEYNPFIPDVSDSTPRFDFHIRDDVGYTTLQSVESLTGEFIAFDDHMKATESLYKQIDSLESQLKYANAILKQMETDNAKSNEYIGD